MAAHTDKTTHIREDGDYGTIKGNAVIHSGNVKIKNVTGHMIVMTPNAQVTAQKISGYLEARDGTVHAGTIGGDVHAKGSSQVFFDTAKEHVFCEENSNVAGKHVNGNTHLCGNSHASINLVIGDVTAEDHTTADIITILGNLQTREHCNIAVAAVSKDATSMGHSSISIYEEVSGNTESRENSCIYAKTIGKDSTSKDEGITVAGNILGVTICSSSKKTQTGIADPQIIEDFMAKVEGKIGKYAPYKEPPKKPTTRSREDASVVA